MCLTWDLRRFGLTAILAARDSGSSAGKIALHLDILSSGSTCMHIDWNQFLKKPHASFHSLHACQKNGARIRHEVPGEEIKGMALGGSLG